MSTLNLVGGGPGRDRSDAPPFQRSDCCTAQEKPLVAYVGAASQDNFGFRKMISLALHGARVEPAKLASKTAKISAARQLLDECDLVFVSGGDVELGMNILRERGVDDDLRRLAKAGKPFLGVSAGAIMMSREWVRFPDDDDTRAEPFECLGIAPVHVDCHSEDDDWSELRVLMRLLPNGSVGYGIPVEGLPARRARRQAVGVGRSAAALPRTRRRNRDRRRRPRTYEMKSSIGPAPSRTTTPSTRSITVVG